MAGVIPGAGAGPDARGEAGWVVWLPAGVALAICAPMLIHPLGLWGPDSFRAHDWLESAKLDAFGRIAVLRHGALPHWNAWLAGGIPQLVHPSDGTLSPWFLTSLLLGEAAGMKLNVALTLAAGAAGVALLARDRCGLRPGFAAFAGVAFALAGWVPSRAAMGYYESTLYTAFPLIAWLALTARGRPLRLLLAALGVAAAAAQVHLGLLVLVLALVLWSLAEWAQRSLRGRELAGPALALAGGALLAAPKLVPMLGYLRRLGYRTVESYPPAVGDYWYGSVGEALRCAAYTVPVPGRYDALGLSGEHDYGYLGLGLPLLLLIAAAIARPHRLHPGGRAALALGALLAWMCFGPNAPLDAFRPLWELPGFHSMRGAVRYLSFGLVWSGALLAGAGLQALAGGTGDAGGRRWPWPVIAAVWIAALAWPAAQSARIYATGFVHPIEPSPPAAAAPTGAGFVQEAIAGHSEFGHFRGGKPRWDRGNLLVYANLKAAIGTIYRPVDLPFSPAPRGARVYDVYLARYDDDPDYRGEAYCLEHDCAAELVAVGPRGFVVRASPERADTLVINQNHDPGFAPSSGELRDVDGLLGVALAGPGPVEIELSYRSAGLGAGVAVAAATLAAWLAIIGVWGRRGSPAPSPPR